MIQNTIRKEVYEGDGSNRTWSIPFAYTSEEDVKIYTVINDVQTEVTENFSILNDVITYPTIESGLPAVDSETKILVIRKTPLTQLESSTETPFTSSDIERALDKVTLGIQDIKEDVDRAVKAPEWSEDSVDTVITDMKNDIGLIDNKVSAETTNRMSADSVLLGQINDINSKIPSTASSTNKLADEQYVRQHAGNSTWGDIQGILSDQTDLKNALDTKANISDIPAAQQQSDWEQNDSTKADYIKNKPAIPDISGKANLRGGNSFSGKQQIYQGEGVDYAITFNKSGVTGTAGFTVGANGVVLSAPSNNLDINNRTVFKNITTLGNITGTTQSLSAFTVEGCYTANLNGTATIKLPTPTSTQTTKENTINILLNIIGDSNITWQDTNSNGINANTCMTTFAVGNYLIKLRYNNATSNWIGEVLKGESVPGTTKAYFSFNDGYADETGNTTLTPVSGYTPQFSSTVAKFGLSSYHHTPTNNQFGYFTCNFNNVVLTGPFNIRFWIRHNGSGAVIFGNPSNISNYVLNISNYGNGYKIYFTAPTASSGSGYNMEFWFASNTSFTSGEWHYIEISRESDNTIYCFLDGVSLGSQSLSGDVYFRPVYLGAYRGIVATTDYYLQDFVIENQVGHTSGYTVPTTPYVISDNSLPDYHDDTKQNSLNNTQLSAVNSGIDTTKVTQISANTTNISTINGKIPAQATSSNQLADKNFVNSSIATNTANFIGTFNSLADLQAYSGTVTNNDYAFVIDTDTAGNTLYERYKYNGTSWVFEYALNNSGFTAAQWAAINSGITAALVSLIGTALQSVPYATSSTIGGVKVEFDSVNGVLNIITED